MYEHGVAMVTDRNRLKRKTTDQKKARSGKMPRAGQLKHRNGAATMRIED